MTETERIRWAIYAAINAILATNNPRRHDVARSLDELAQRYR